MSRTVILQIAGGHSVLVDDDHPSYFYEQKWHVVCGPSGILYARTRVFKNGRRISLMMHRAILEVPPGFEVDHINRNGLDNRRNNLRLATRSQNLANRAIQANNSSGFRGVRKYKNRYWIAQIKFDNRQIYLGCFTSPEAAAQAYDREARLRFGEFASLNFPESIASGKARHGRPDAITADEVA